MIVDFQQTGAVAPHMAYSVGLSRRAGGIAHRSPAQQGRASLRSSGKDTTRMAVDAADLARLRAEQLRPPDLGPTRRRKEHRHPSFGRRILSRRRTAPRLPVSV
jgi:hypothetical protein